jgi:hypothetical protein
MRRLPLRWVLVLALAAGCGGGGVPAVPDTTGDPGGGGPPPGAGDWYRPPLDVTWHWQLTGTIDPASYDVNLYDVDLFDTPVAVIEALHARGVKVVAYFSAGSAENWRPDYDDYAADDLGEPLDGWPGERWVDIRSQTVRALLLARIQLAAQKGFDGIEPDNVDGYANDTGFGLTKADQIAFNRDLAAEAHRRGLCIALKNATEIVDALAGDFDLAMNEECHMYAECDVYGAFLDLGKPVLNAEYAATAGEAAALAAQICPQATAAGLRTLILPLDLDDSFRTSCP